MKKALLLGLIIGLITLWPTYGEVNQPEFSDEELKWLSEHPVIYYAPDSEFPPYEYHENGTFKGIIFDYHKILEDILNVKIEIVKTDSWSEVLDLAKNSEVDFLFLTKTIERNEYLSFTDPFVVAPNVILVNDNSDKKINSENLGEHSFGVIKDYAAAEFTKLVYPEAEITEYSTADEGLLDLSFGKIDAFIMDLGQGTYSVKELSINNLNVADKIDFDDKMSFGVPLDKRILSSILDKGIKSIPKREHDEIMNKWVEIQYMDWLSSRQMEWVFYGAVIVFTIAIFVLFWNWLLRKTVNEKTFELNELNKSLEDKVFKRTEELKITNRELEVSLKNITDMQDKLIETKKYAALGEIVTGVAHEINTPIGNGITSISYAIEKLGQLQESLDKGNLGKTQLEKTLLDLNETIDIVSKSLNKVGSIVKKFKALELSQISDRVEKINLGDEIESIVEIHGFRKDYCNEIDIITRFEDVVLISTSKIWLEEVVVNLIRNSITHGFKNKENGLITITINLVSDSRVRMIYEDNGIGIKTASQNRVFDPFYSEGKMAENMGLGLSVVYNAVVVQLSGTIELESLEGEYTRFVIELPI